MDFTEITSGWALLVSAEAALNLSGAALLWMALTGRLRAGHRALKPWPVSVEFFIAAAALVLIGGFVSAYVLQNLPNSVLGASAKDTEWWQIVLTGGYQGGLLVGVILSVTLIRLFDSGFKAAQTKPASEGAAGGTGSVRSSENAELTGFTHTEDPVEHRAESTPTGSDKTADSVPLVIPAAQTGEIAITGAATHQPTTILHTFGAALATFAITTLLVNSLGGIWKSLLQAAGESTPEQQVVDMFRQGGDVSKMAVMTFIAVVAAPITEELIFRAGLFRYLRSRVLRPFALAIPALIFAVLHGNAVAFLPLAILSICFSIAYERTGRIAVPMIAHALFNLHTVLLVMAGVTA